MTKRNEYEGSVHGTRQKQTIVYGVMPVIEILRAGSRPLERVIIAEGKPHKRIMEIRELAANAGVVVTEVPRQVIDKMAGKGAN